MNRLIAVTAAAALALAACRDTASNPLTSPELSPASANGLACNFGVSKPAFRTYFSGPLSPIEALADRD